jgi:hypothetical protein
MSSFSRRNFIKQLGAFVGLTLTGQTAFPKKLFSDSKISPAFEFLVIGDSLVWGQGLLEEQKIYHLTRQWLETEIFKNSRPVNLKVKAHSGARIILEDPEVTALRKAKIAEYESFHPEVNLLFPSLLEQLEIARKEYENPQAVDLILLSGGITNVGISTILNPRKNNEELKIDIIKHCNGEMFKVLEHAAQNFPNALIALLGYYPFLSKETPSSKIFNNVIEVYDIPGLFKPVINNPLNRRVLKSYQDKMVERSLIWAEDSALEFKRAVDRLNAQSGKQRAVFVASPIREENSIGASKALLYEVGKNGKAQDPRAEERKQACRKTLGELKQSTGMDFRVRRCELATIGHPNPEGSKAYAEAIQNSLKPFLSA